MIVEISERRALAIELLDLERRLAPELAAIERLKGKLKSLAEQGGTSFEESVEGAGLVKVRPAKAGGYRGLLPVLDAELFEAADAAEQDRLKVAGLVRIVAQYSRGSYAAVTVEVDPAQ